MVGKIDTTNPSVESIHIKYLNVSSNDELWGMVISTVGYQYISPYTQYPPLRHPESYFFNPQNGRILKEYQLVYISRGSGYFESASVKRQKIEPGTMILLFPDEWHSYEPDKKNGWFEYWVGFRGMHIDRYVEKGFFTKKSPIYYLGFDSTAVSLYESILEYALKEEAAYQQIISSIVIHLLGVVYYKNKNATFTDSFVVNKINEARAIMKQEINHNISPEAIAATLNVSYSWFRKMFKKYVDVSPAQYQAYLKYMRSKELLDTTELNITEIAYKLGFENTGQFSTFFRKKEGIPPLQYRKLQRGFDNDIIND